MPEIDKGEFPSYQAAKHAIHRSHTNPAAYDTPWWGDKETESGNLSNRGYVIGFRDTGTHAQWRLDYDEDKKLHINWTQEVAGGETLKECYRIASTRPRETQWDYYVVWTKPIFEEIPVPIKQRLDTVGGVKKWNGRCWAP